MKYIRTKERINDLSRYKLVETSAGMRKYMYILNGGFIWYREDEIIKQADTIEKLCDLFIGIYKDEEEIEDKEIGYCFDFFQNEKSFKEVYGAIWTDKGLIYVAKMNDKGELELL